MNEVPGVQLLILWLAILAGCASGRERVPAGTTQAATKPAALLLLVPGVQGDVGYDALLRGLRAGGIGDTVQTHGWGAPLPFFFLNYQTDWVHHAAEADLATQIEQVGRTHPGEPIDLIGHSAGCGVILGALARLPAGMTVRCVVLLAPSVSPRYDLGPALGHVSGRLNIFYSDRDRLFLSWRTRTFGTYDNVHTRAAGNCGFAGASAADKRVVQHPYDPAWQTLGNDGDHFGTLAEPFAKAIIAPLFLAAGD